MERDEITIGDATPNPMETVRILRSDYEALQTIADVAVEDVETLAKILAMYRPEGMSHRQFLLERLFPRVIALMQTQAHVDEASEQILARAKEKGMVTKDFGNGVKGLLVGKKVPGLFDNRG